MSEMSIPGASSKYNVDKMIENLMKVERKPLEKLEKQVELYNTQKSSWAQFDKQLKAFRTSTNYLYSFDNPFNNKSFNSSDDQFVTGTANKNAAPQDFTIKVNKIAKADRLTSAPISENATVPEGKYTFGTGDKQVSFYYRGGSFEDFADKINSRGSNQISAKVIRTSPDEKVFIIESQITGKNNRLIFQDDALNFALDNNIIKKNTTSAFSPNLQEDKLFSQEKNGLLLTPNSQKSFDIDSSKLSPDSEITITLKVINNKKPSPFDGSPTGPDIKNSGEINLDDINIENEKSEINDINIDENLVPKEVIDNNFLEIQTSSKNIAYGEISAENEEIQIKIKLSDLEGDLKALVFSNKNTDRDLVITGINISDPNAEAEYVAVSPISEASDAEFEFEGIKVTRDSNNVDDLVAGVNIKLEREGGESRISIKPDTQGAKDAIVNMVIEYNRLIDTITFLTTDKEEDLDKLNYLYYGMSQSEIDKYKEENKDKMGILRGDSTVLKIRNALRQTMYEAYTLSNDNPFKLLSQIGISTNESGFSGYSADSMAGYLQLDEKKLDAALESDMSFVKELFGYDSSGDLIVDSGVAYKLNTLIAPYTRTGGILANKISGFDRQIKETKEDITDMEKALEAKEAEYKRKYYQMEGLMDELQKNSESLDNLKNNN
ncbi:MAG: flagellar filament capping protein FliD [Spirochaetales bacterium]|nr:flagellar filament capping protein FliD [Spirochaetales bacterium]